MSGLLRFVWGASIFVCFASVAAFPLGATDVLRQGPGREGWISLVFFWLPALGLTILSGRLFLKKWTPAGDDQRLGLWFLMTLKLAFSYMLVSGIFL